MFEGSDSTVMERYERTRVLIEGDPALAHEIVLDVEKECARAASEGMRDSSSTVVVLEEPHEELVMVQARETAKGSLFYLGEALMTSCRVRFAGMVGYGFVLGGDRCRAYELAVIDAAFTGEKGPERIARWRERLAREQRTVRAREAREASRIASTKVDFSAMADEAEARPCSVHTDERVRASSPSVGRRQA